MLFTLLVLFYLIVCVALILAVLLQSGKGQGMASAFGGSAVAGTVFGGRGAATFLSKVTTILAILFMLLVLGLNLVPSSSQAPKSVIREEALKTQQESPAKGLPAAPSGGKSTGPVTPPAKAQPQTPGQTPPPASTPSKK
ncbi:MAG: preprotein translocase subunit SecG [Candidatus Latescibacteria bacterium]|nr:preprotein translocase subunit SecG [Candidatus Latescibacterota bacterium]